MIFRMLSKTLRYLIFSLAALLVLLCLLFAVLQSKWAKLKIKDQVLLLLKEHGIMGTMEGLSGKLPFVWTIQSADFQDIEGNRMHMEHLRCRVAIFPLLRNEIKISYLTIEKAELFASRTEPHTKETLREIARNTLEDFQLFAHLKINHLRVSQALVHLNTTDALECKPIAFAIQAKLSARKDLSHFEFDLDLSDTAKNNPFLEFYAHGSLPQNDVAIDLKAHMNLPFTELQGKLSLIAKLDGEWTTWQEILNDRQITNKPLNGEIKGILTPQLALKSERMNKAAALVNRPWKLLGRFHIASLHSAVFQKCALSSDLFHLKGRGELFREWEKSLALLAFSIPDLSPLSTALDTPIEGKLTGKTFFQNKTLKSSFRTDKLIIDHFNADQVLAIARATVEEGAWAGNFHLLSKEAQIPFENYFSFALLPQKIYSIKDFELQVPDGSIEGHLTCCPLSDKYDGKLDVSINQIERFAELIGFEGIDGNLVLLAEAKNARDKQAIKFSFLGTHLRYRDALLENLSLSARIKDLFHNPEGRFHLLAEKLYSPNLRLEQLTLGTTSDVENWPFHFSVAGELDKPFQCDGKGVALKEGTLYSVELSECAGDLFGSPFHLRRPSLLEWGADSIDLSPFEMQIGMGKLYTTFAFSPIRGTCSYNLEHFPLEVFNFLRPRLTLKGMVTASGFIDAYPQSIEGALNAVLEHADVLHYGKKKPLQAKGSIQAHLNNTHLQLHTDFHGTGAQFLDFSATLPVAHSLYPFRIDLEKEKPTAAELIAEGNLEDLFDFVNLGMNHLSGHISSRLFLSRTLATPSLNGRLDWENGTYENYYTGVALKRIRARLEADDDEIRLLKLSARDEKKGKLSAKGKIHINPKEGFPYGFNAELKDLHALGFKMIDCNFTGPLYFTGNLNQALAEGNLLIDEAKIQLTEQLPYEIPILPVTFIHRPSHLLSQSFPSAPRFQFHIDLELTADNKVFVEGMGLNAELNGNVHLTGTNTNVQAAGSLKLIKGEYQFSGKVFKLTEGEIVFTDKPTPNAYLNLNGTLSLPNASITAMLRGSLTHPQLTFQSNPQMSSSSILALILFNKDISDISHPEALQLASTLMSLSGGAGPDVLETIRKTIGVDRLNIVSASADSDEIAVQIGKYLTRGVMITLSQSATSSQVIVEVELPHGFVFQAETQEEEEGKFSLKWTKSY